MEHNNNIEELFRSKLQSFEADPGPAGWSAVQSQLKAARTASASSGAAMGGYKAFLLISGLSVLIGLGLGYTLWNSDEKQDVPAAQKSTPVLAAEEDLVTAKEQGTSIDDDHVSSVILVEEKQEKSGEPVKKRTKLVLPQEMGNPSIAQSWMTPSDKKEKLMNGTTVSTQQSTSSEKTSTTTKEENKQNQRVDVLEIPVAETAPLALISSSVSGGPAPLFVEFKNSETAAYYEWNFGDGHSSREAAPMHKFEEPGTYQVSLLVKDQQGNSSTDKITIQVREGSYLKNPNVFTPNGRDGNDYFRFETKNIVALFIQVMTRDGRVVFESNDVNFAWDGKDQQGKQLPAGIYFYHFKAIDHSGKEYKDASQLTIKY